MSRAEEWSLTIDLLLLRGTQGWILTLLLVPSSPALPQNPQRSRTETGATFSPGSSYCTSRTQLLLEAFHDPPTPNLGRYLDPLFSCGPRVFLCPAQSCCFVTGNSHLSSPLACGALERKDQSCPLLSPSTEPRVGHRAGLDMPLLRG